MSWLEVFQYAIYGLGGAVVLLWLFNLSLAIRGRRESVAARRMMFILAFVLLGLSIARSSQLYGSTGVFANILVLGCITVAFVRSEREKNDAAPE